MGMSSDYVQRQREFCDRAFRVLPPRILPSAMPIRAQEKSKLELVGSGTLFRVADVHLLVTAFHVLVPVDGSPHDRIWLTTSPDGGTPFPLENVRVHTEQGGSKGLDVAVIELTPATVEKLHGFEFLSVQETIRDQTLPNGGRLYTFGFPIAHCEQDDGRIVFNAVGHEGEEFTGAVPSGMEFNPRIHILVDYSPTLVWGERIPGYGMPMALNGLSGSSLWYSRESELPQDGQGEGLKVAGFLAGVREKRWGYIVKATRWWAVDQLLRNRYPHLRSALDLRIA